jgi:hypothetical protein
MSVKSLSNIFDLNSKWARTLPLRILQEFFIGAIPQYRSWNFTPCRGHEVQKPTQAFKSAKGPGNTFDLNSKWARKKLCRLELYTGCL